MESRLHHTRGLAVAMLMTIGLAVAQPAFAETLTVAWDPSMDISVAGYVVYVGTQSGVYSQTFNAGTSTSFSYTAALPGQRYYFAVAAYADGPVTGARSAEVSGVSNLPPTITNPGNRTSDVGQTVTLQLTASDPDGMPVTFSASGLPAGLILTSSTGYISGAATTAGTYAVTVVASDGVLKSSTTFTWTVNGQSVTAPMPVSPSGTITSASPSYIWNAARGAVSYVLNVDDSVNPGKVRMTISASAAGCATTTVCRVTPGVTLAPGTAHWAVETIASTGPGPWSGSMSFVIPDVLPPTIGLLSPAAATFYESTQSALTLAGVASDNGVVASVSWSNSRGGSGTAIGTTNWKASLSLLPGSNTITLTARDAAGNVAKVATTAVYVVPPTPLSPNDVGPATPLFTWTAAPSATSYVLSVRDSTQTETVHMTVTPDQARCPTGGTCAFDPGVALAAGAARWSVETIVRSDLGAWSAPAYFMVDTTPPLVEITSPSRSANFGTKNTSVTLGGSAGDNVKVAMVTWTDDQGRAGIAQGTSQWSTDPIPMVSGRTTFTVTALDAAGNIATDTITVYGAAQLSTLR